jgi:hypothetical protein
MRIEMAIASAPPNTHVEELPEPVTVIYGRANSDRANYGRAARAQDVHLAAWIARFAASHPGELSRAARLGMGALSMQGGTLLHRTPAPTEEWRVRTTVSA